MIPNRTAPSRAPRARLLQVLLAVSCALAAPGLAKASDPPGAGSAAAEKSAADFAATIEKAHGLAAWKTKRGLQARIKVDFGGRRAIDGTMLLEIGTGRSRFALLDGTTLVWDGAEAWVSPAASSFKGARFHVLTWPYFLSVPMKLRDPGARLAALGPMALGGRQVPAARLTFDAGTGDTPDDWYILYQDPATGRLATMAYIVTYGSTREQAEKETHAISYEDFVEVEGVRIPRRWTWHAWSREEGITGEPVGSAWIDDVRFVTPGAGSFDRPADARGDPIPGH